VASAVFQPMIVVESFAIAWTFLAAGLAWQDRGAPGRRWVSAGADASFGVYLAHPLLIQGLLATGITALAAGQPAPVVTAVILAVAVPVIYLTCVAATAALRSTPLSLPLTGHPRRRTRAVAPSVSVSPGGLRCERQTA
jgi:peptidoglycan/LPS O-acetylase OafA/YrhL